MKHDEIKAKRKLTDFDFSKKGAAIALVHKDQGGAANGYKTLVMKATDKYSEEFIQKASQIRVTLSLPDFLEKFFHVWDDDAEVLAAMFGYVESEDDSNEYDQESFWCWYREKSAKEGTLDHWGDPITRPTPEDKQQWLKEQLQGIEILKSAQAAKGSAEFITGLTEEQYLTLLKDQAFIEKSFVKKDTSGGEPELSSKSKQTKAVKADTKGKKMETIEKAQYDAKEVELQKALADIQKAKEEIEAFKAKEKLAIEKARTEAIASVISDKDEAVKLFKAVSSLESEDFETVVNVMKALDAKVDESDLFKEKGSPEQGVEVKKSSLQAMIDAKYKKA